jgi:hypothetical protein
MTTVRMTEAMVALRLLASRSLSWRYSQETKTHQETKHDLIADRKAQASDDGNRLEHNKQIRADVDDSAR